jgi:hypothetical protein
MIAKSADHDKRRASGWVKLAGGFKGMQVKKKLNREDPGSVLVK